MNAKPVVTLIATTLFSISCYAHDCSGGPNGGMDATGNQCNDTAAYSTTADNDTTRNVTSDVTPAVSPGHTLSNVTYTPNRAKTSKKASTRHHTVAVSMPRN